MRWQRFYNEVLVVRLAKSVWRRLAQRKWRGGWGSIADFRQHRPRHGMMEYDVLRILADVAVQCATKHSEYIYWEKRKGRGKQEYTLKGG